MSLSSTSRCSCFDNAEYTLTGAEALRSLSGVNMRVLCRGYLNEESSSLETLGRHMKSIQTGEIMRPELEIVSMTQEDDVLHLDALFVQGTGDFAGWFVRRQRPRHRERQVFCKDASGDAMVEAIHCGAPEVIRKNAVLQTEEVLSLFSRLIESSDTNEYRMIKICEAFVR
jgi:hypothetical protein